MESFKCPCGSGNNYSACCEPWHRGEVSPSALDVMKARYSAYVLNHADYIINTTHPASTHYNENFYLWKKGINKFSLYSHFEKLVIHHFHEEGDLASVTFTAFLSQEGQDATFTEKSYFEKRKGQWLYLRGRGEAGLQADLSKYPEQHFPLAYYGDPILSAKAVPVAAIDEEIKALVADMIEAMHSFPGMGLAAPQVKRSLRLFIAQPPIEKEKGKLEPGPIEVYINPKLSMPSSQTWDEEEGCLSIPIIRGKVRRPVEITVEYTNLEGETLTKRATGWEAKVIQHEYDHIEGILFTELLEKKERYQLEPRLRQLKQRLAS